MDFDTRASATCPRRAPRPVCDAARTTSFKDCTMRNLASYAQGTWHPAADSGTTLHHAVTGEPVAIASSDGLDFGGLLDYARTVGGPAVRQLTFHERAAVLKELGKYLTDRK